MDIDRAQFYYRLEEKKEQATTSQPTPAKFAAVYNEIAQDGAPIISIHISSQMSGTCQSAKLAQKLAPSIDLTVIDSKLVSMGLGLVVLEAAAAAQAGKSKEEILVLIGKLLPRTHVFFIVNSLEYLARGGRIAKAEAFLGTILQVKPLLYIKNGVVNPYEKIRGKTRAISRLIELTEEIAAKQKIKCSLVHGNDPVGVEQLQQRIILSRLQRTATFIDTLGMVVGIHAGPSTLGIAFTIID